MKLYSNGAAKVARSKWVATGAALALVVGVGGFAAQAANAEGGSLAVYDEADSPNPFSLTNALVFYKGADLGWVVNTPIADVHSLGYTVADGKPVGAATEGYAPSFQLVTKSDQKSYARLVWEPYQQVGALDANTGAYTDVEDGVWWTNKIANGNPGSQADPQPLSFFYNDGGAGWTNVVVGAITIKQGTTTDVVSTVTKVSFNGTDMALGNADTTPFDSSDVTAATTPLNGQIASQTAQITALQAQLAAKTAELAAYKASHHTADGTKIGLSRALLAATPVHGRTVGVKLSGTIAKATAVKYQWYLSGIPVAGATKSTYKVPANAKGRSVSVMVTGTSSYITFAIHSNTVTAK